MKITVIAAGKIKEKWIAEGVAEYAKRLERFVNLSIIEIADEKIPETFSAKEKVRAVEKEGRKMLDRWPNGALGIAMDPNGRSLGSEGLAQLMEETAVNGRSHIVFAIGGSNGLSHEVRGTCQRKISFGPHIFPHQLFRVMLLEQIYRAQKIIAGETYHK